MTLGTAATGLRRIALAGNPNTGKTTLFNRLTGSRARVGNYPGVTVDRHYGRLALPSGGETELVDVPGTYSLSANSEDEKLALGAIAGLHPQERPDATLIVIDGTQLLRNLYLVLQVLELDGPTVVAVNMMDQVREAGLEIDFELLESELGVPVVPIVAKRGEGLPRLVAALERVLAEPGRANTKRRWEPEAALEDDVAAVGRTIPLLWHRESTLRCRALALWALLSVDEEDELLGVPADLREAVRERRALAGREGRHIDEEIIRGRYDWLDEHIGPALVEGNAPKISLTDRVDRVLLHPALGFVIFLTIMTIVFQSLFAWADPAIGLIEDVVAGLSDLLSTHLPEGFVTDLLVEGIVAGVGGVLVFLPQILLLFFFLGLMEDSGYMARVAYIMDRLMKTIGLNGRAFVPMLSGFACAVPAILATRTMERQRDRLLTMMVVPLMTCSARLPVYGLLIAALYPPGQGEPFVQGLLMVAMYLFSTVIALAAAAVLGRTVLKGRRTPLLLEMPPYRMPVWRSVLRAMWQKSAVFVREAGTVILVCTIAMWALLSFPKQTAEDLAKRQEAVATNVDLDAEARAAELERIETEFAGEGLRESYGGRLGLAIEPTIEPLGFDWKIGIGIIGAFAAREVFVSTMAVVYGLADEEDAESRVLRERVRDQEWPDGRKVYTPLVCFSLMVFFALACQCMSTLAVVKRETASWRWPVFLFVYMTALAWVASFIVYQGGQLVGLG